MSPQKERGYVGIANDIWDEIICRDFTKRQKDILQFILRLSYGCNQKSAFVPLLKNFALCGVQANKIRSELERLERCNVIFWNREANEFRFNKNYDLWDIKNVKKWDSKLYKGLIHLNLINSKKARTEVPEKGTEPEQEDFPKGEPELPEKGSEDSEKFPKREVPLPEKGSATPFEPNQGAASGASKKGLKPLSNKDSLNKDPKTSSRQRKTYAEDSPSYRMALYLHQKVMVHAEASGVGHLVRNSNMQSWANDCRKLLELDKVDKSLIKSVIDWATEHHFWKKNILCASKLREKFKQLAIDMHSEKPRGTNSLQSKNDKTAQLIREAKDRERVRDTGIVRSY